MKISIANFCKLLAASAFCALAFTACGNSGSPVDRTSDGNSGDGGGIYEFCGIEAYNPAKNFCYADSIYDKCDTSAYNPAKQFCVDDVVYEMCGGKTYDVTEKFCYDGKLYPLCGGYGYNVKTETCIDGVIYGVCDNETFNPTTEFCSSGSVYDKCGGEAYDPTTQFCSYDMVYALCSGKTYDVTKKFCYGSKLYPLCGGYGYNVKTETCIDGVIYGVCDNETFNPTTEFCSSGSVYDKCGGEAYDPTTQFCSYDMVYALCSGKTYDVTKKFCYGSKLYPLCGGNGYNVETEFCEDGKVYGTCAGKIYDPTTCTCEGGTVIEIAGTLTDSRDGQTYKTVKIGSQTWMAENLNFNYNAGTATSFCYENADAYCTIYGRLYTWSAAMDSVGAFSSNGLGCGYGSTCGAVAPVRGACPEGWHLPSQEEFQALVDFTGGEDVAGKALKSTVGWNDYSGESGNGTDAYGFAGFAAGADYCGNRFKTACFNSAGKNAYFWTSTTYSGIYSSYAHALHLSYDGPGATLDTRNVDWDPEGLESSGDKTPTDPKSNAFSVRCLKDY